MCRLCTSDDLLIFSSARERADEGYLLQFPSTASLRSSPDLASGSLPEARPLRNPPFLSFQLLPGCAVQCMAVKVHVLRIMCVRACCDNVQVLAAKKPAPSIHRWRWEMARPALTRRQRAHPCLHRPSNRTLWYLRMYVRVNASVRPSLFLLASAVNRHFPDYAPFPFLFYPVVIP